MKSTLGKLGMGFAGAAAFAGLMSASVQTAQAQLELLPAPPGGLSVLNPTVSQVNSSTWSYSYYVGVVWSTNNSYDLQLSNNPTNPNYFSLEFSGYVPNSYSYAVTNFSATGLTNVDTTGAWTPTYAGGVLTLTYTGGTTITVLPTGTASGSTYPSEVALGEFTFQSNIGPSSSPEHLFTSSINEVAPNNGGFFTNVGESTSAIGPALPLPAAFWPGLLTIGGMAVVGGLRMRRRTV